MASCRLKWPGHPFLPQPRIVTLQLRSLRKHAPPRPAPPSVWSGILESLEAQWQKKRKAESWAEVGEKEFKRSGRGKEGRGDMGRESKGASR